MAANSDREDRHEVVFVMVIVMETVMVTVMVIATAVISSHAAHRDRQETT
jgi:hypothetical protein